jgi:hypothetical protein
MSGVAAPQYPITEPFGTGASPPTDITLPIPVPSQVGVLTGAASFADGFPAATRTDPEAGGVPPFGQDMNGILFMLSQYAALIQAGQLVPFDAAVATVLVGYAVGAKVASAATPGRIWTNWLDGNTNDPDSVETGWAASDPLHAVDAPAAGTYNDVVLPGASDYVLDTDTTAGNVVYTGFVAQRIGQRITHANTGANLLSIHVGVGSAANNQVRGIDLDLAPGQTATLQKVTDGTLNKWVFV